MQKLERDGMVAVVYSPGYGAGWVTWSDATTREQREGLVMDADIACAVLAKDLSLAAKIARERYVPDMYLGGVEDLAVAWLPKGTSFMISEYDGYESVNCHDNLPWFVA